MRILCMFVLACLLLMFSSAFADVDCDGIDDDLDNATTVGSFYSSTTATLTLWLRPTGTGATSGTGTCIDGERWWGDVEVLIGGSLMIARNDDYPGTGGGDRLCVSNDTGTFQTIAAPYTLDAWTHIALVHGGGNLLMYKDGLLVSSTASGTSTASSNAIMHLCGGKDGAISGVASGKGRVAEAMTFPTALSAGEIASLGASHLHYIASSAPSGYWPLDDCGDGVTGNAVAFADRSGNNRVLTGDDGANNTGLICRAGTALTYPWGVE
jgi:Concanavalin A-like lectin/glucanases superfamily